MALDAAQNKLYSAQRHTSHPEQTTLFSPRQVLMPKYYIHLRFYTFSLMPLYFPARHRVSQWRERPPIIKPRLSLLLEDRDGIGTPSRSKIRDDLGAVTEYRVLHISIGKRVYIDTSARRIDRHCTLLTSVIGSTT